MTSPIRQWSPGDPLNGISNEFLNGLTRMYSDWLRRQGGGQVVSPIHGSVYVKNVSGGDLIQCSVVNLGDPLATPGEDETAHFGDSCYETAAVVANASFGIIQEPLIEDGIALAKLSGETYVRLNLSLTTHDYAAPSAGVYEHLVSQAAPGPARILWTNVPENTQLNGAINNSVTALTVDTSDNWPPSEEFVILIDSEKMLVTDVTGTTWTVTRAYAGTSAASHLDNAAISFVSGTIWALVNLQGNTASSGITSVNSQTGPAITHAVGTTGSDHNIAASGNTVTHHLPDAGASARGAITTGTQTIAGAKTFTGFVSATVGLSAAGVSSYGGTPQFVYTVEGVAGGGDAYGMTRAVSGSTANELYTQAVPDTGSSYHRGFVIRSSVDSGGVTANKACYSIFQVDSGVGGAFNGAWATVSGLVFAGGLYISGTLSVSSSDVGLGSVENTALSTWAGTTNITTLGTISTGTWNGTTIGLAKGGTASDLSATGPGIIIQGTNAAALTCAQETDFGALTDNTAGTANTTLEALADGTVYANDVASIRNNFADLAAQVNKVRDVLRNLKAMA